MYSTQQRMHQTTSASASASRTIITWMILIIIMLYFLHSSNHFLPNHNSNCPNQLHLPTSEKHLHDQNHITTNNNNNNNITSSDEQERELGEEREAETEAEQEQVEELETSVVVQLPPETTHIPPTELKHVVFGIAASSNLWNTRKEYIKTWWKPGQTRGVVWLDQRVRTTRNEGLPDIRISADTSKFKYRNRQGHRSALRISRIVTETLKLGMKDVRWLVMGDDDTVFVVENVVRILQKYDHRHLYYIGSSSESHVQNIHFSYAMAYGGGGFAISYPLAKQLAKMQDRCIQRYPNLYGSDDRIQACMAELGVPLTKEPGFHQYDVYGDLLGLLGSHPVAPLVTLHHLDLVEPIFPHLSRVEAIERLMESVEQDSASVMQQSICYDKNKYWSISVSWGYVVQVWRGIMSPRELEMPSRTFLNWYRRADYTAYTFNTRPVFKHPCQKPFVFYMTKTRYDQSRRQIIGTYFPDRYAKPSFCRWRMDSPHKVDTIVVLKRPDPLRWQKSPRRDCCRVLPSRKRSTMYLWVGNCRDGEISEL